MHSHGMWLGLLLAGAVAAPTGAAQASGDEAAVRQLIAAQVEAWNRGDARAHAADCRDDVLFTNVLGATYDTRTAFEERHAVIFGSFFRGSRLSTNVARIRFPTQDVALVDLDTAVTGYQALPPGTQAAADGSLRTRLLQVLVKTDGRWQVAAYHNVDVKRLPGQP